MYLFTYKHNIVICRNNLSNDFIVLLSSMFLRTNIVHWIRAFIRILFVFVLTLLQTSEFIIIGDYAAHDIQTKICSCKQPMLSRKPTYDHSQHRQCKRERRIVIVRLEDTQKKEKTKIILKSLASSQSSETQDSSVRFWSTIRCSNDDDVGFL